MDTTMRQRFRSTAAAILAIFLGLPACAGADEVPSADGSVAGGAPGGGATSGGVTGGGGLGEGGLNPGAGGTASGGAGGGGSGGAAGAGGAETGGLGNGSGGFGSGGEGVGPGGTGPAGAGGDPGAGGGATMDCDPARTLAPGDHDFTLASANGITYRYTVVVPPTVVPGRKAPLALVWHALTSSPEETRGLTHLDETTAALGVITVHPRSPDASWDVGSCCTGIVLGRRRDETVFARELLAEVKARLCIDERRIYTSGFSNGGMMSNLLACKMADVFAASAPMGSTLTIPANECQPSRPVPMFMINGTADPLVGYAAPSLSGGLAVPAAFETWASRNGCTGQPEVTLQVGKATCRSYRTCAGGAEVTLCSVEGMGHCIPGMDKESAVNCFTKLIPLGPPNDDIDGVQLAAEFLTRYSLP